MAMATRSLTTAHSVFRRGVRQLATQSNASATNTQSKERPIIFSGIQPTGQPHLGNYFGAISNWITLQEQAFQDKETVLFSIVDLHAITMPQDPEKLRRERREMAITLLACGVDPKKCILFEQSKVSGHCELTWILNCMTSVGWLARMTQWKSKLGVTKGAKSIEDVSATAGLQMGLLAYPVLMAADVLLYRATKIPVGEDQVQHLELARDIAQLFNKTVNQPFFPLPRPLITETKRVMSLRDPKNKMSKSDPSDQTRIHLVDKPEVIASKIKRATTDSIRGITYDKIERPAVANLIEIYAGAKRIGIQDVVKEHAESSTAVFKEALTEALVSLLKPIQDEMARLDNERAYVQSVLNDGALKATEIANPNLREVQRLMGLL
ncbi:Tryptophan--tRNA ligase, mitochondrial [Mortierella sp. NVP85]|nr:Tryptophan--tRNA ligase, mitochondrial [Mortierella sp. NVP85]